MARRMEELENGVVVWQVTEEPERVSNIYCERPYASPDGRHFLYARRTAEDWEYRLCTFGSWETRVVGRGLLVPAVSYQGDVYYARPGGRDGLEFVRIDLQTGLSEVRFAVAGIRAAGHPTVSPDGRYLAFHRALSYDPQRFGIFLVDRDGGACELLHEDPWLCNAHSQFDAAAGRTLLIQHNRGCAYRPDGSRIRLTGEKEGACTLFLLAAPSGRVTRLPVGLPYTTPLTGHQAWVGPTREIILTVHPRGAYDATQGNILLVREGEASRQAVPGVWMGHIGTTPCGRYFHADGGPEQMIIVGSPRTGRFVEVCRSHTRNRPEFGQDAHPHAYLTPDYRWVVFNSDRTGTPQTYAAALPPGLLDPLED